MRAVFVSFVLPGLVGTMALLCGVASAADIRWLGGSGAWTSGNWAGGAFPNSFADVARIDDGAPSPSIVTLDAPVEIGGVVIDAGDRLSVGTGTLTLRGTLANAGQLSIANSGALVAAADLTLAGSGETRLAGGRIRAATSTGSSPPVLTVAADHVLRGGGEVTAGFQIVNHGRIVAEGADPLVVFTHVNQRIIVNHGRVEVSDGAWLFLDSPLVGGKVTVASTGTIGGLLKDVEFSGTLGQRSLDFVRLAGTFTNKGATVQVGDSSVARQLWLLQDTVLAGNAETVLVRGWLAGGGARLTIGPGHTVRSTIAGGIGADSVLNLGRIEVVGGSLDVSLGTALSRIENRGAVVVDRDAEVHVWGTLLQDAGTAQTTVRGRLTIFETFYHASAFELVDGTLAGDGSLRIGGLGLLQTGGAIEPGASVGRLRIDLDIPSRFVQHDDALLVFDLDGQQPGISHDVIEISGGVAVSLNGRVRLNFGYTPAVGDSFDVLRVIPDPFSGTGPLLTGTFDVIEVPAGILVVPSYAADRVTLTVAAIPEPHTYALMAFGLAIVGYAARCRRPRKLKG